MAAPSKSWLQATGVSQDVRDMESGALAALMPAMAAAQKELQQDLAAWYAKLGPTAAQDKFTPAQLRQMQLLLGVAEASGSSKAKYPHASFPFIASKAVLGVMQKQEAPAKAVNTLVGELDMLRGKFADMPSPQLMHAAMLAKGDHLVLDRYKRSTQRYAGQVKDDLKLQFGIGLAKGETVQQLTTRIAALSGFRTAVDASHPNDAAQATAGALVKRYHNWAKRLAITELNNAYNKTAADGIREAHAQDDRVVMMWDASNDMRVCPICRDLHGETLDPKDADATFPGGYLQPPAHPYCFPAGTPVLTARGWVGVETVVVGDQVLTHRDRWCSVTALARREAPILVTLTDDAGLAIDTTPEHPFATPRGWVAAELVEKLGTQVWVLREPAAEAYHTPTSAGERSFLADVALGMPRRGVPVPAINLNGDLVRHDGQVYNKTPNLVSDNSAEVNNRGVDVDLISGFGNTGVSLGAVDQLVTTSFTASSRDVCSVDLGGLISGRHVGVAADVVLMGGAQHASRNEHAGDGSATHVESLCQGHRGVAGHVQADDERFIELGFADHKYTLLSMRVTNKPGAVVYSIQVAEDESFIAGRCVVHNCRCSVVAWMADWDANAPDVPMPPSAEELDAQEAAQAAAAQAEQDALAQQAANGKRRANASAQAVVASHEDLEAYQDHKQAEALEKQLAEAEAKHKAALEAAALAKAQAEAEAAKAKAEADALAKKVAEDQAKVAALQAQADALLAKQIAEQEAAYKAYAEKLAAEQAKVAAAQAQAEGQKQWEAKQAADKIKKAANAAKKEAKLIGGAAPFDPAASPKLSSAYYKKGTGQTTLLSNPGMVKVGADKIVGHGYVYEWSGGKWKATTHPGATHSWNWSTNKWEVFGTPAATAPPVAMPAPPTPAQVVPTMWATDPQPAAIVGHEWKQTNGEWKLYKAGSAVSTDTQIVPHVQGTPAKTMQASYALGGELAKEGMVPVAPGVMMGHGYTFTKDTNSGQWVKTHWQGVALPKPAATVTPKPSPYGAAAAPVPSWKPLPIELAPNRKGVTDFDAHPSHEYHGMHGRAFTQDGDIVEGGSVRVVKVKDETGKVYYETMFKVTHPYGDLAKTYGTGESGTWTFNRRNVKGGVMTDTGTTQGQAVKTRIRQDGTTRVEIGASGAVSNQVRIRASSLAELNTAMDGLSKHLGADLRKPPEKEDLILQAKARLAAKFNPAAFGAQMSKAGTPDQQKQVINDVFDAMAKHHPVMAKALADAKEVEVYPGHKTLYSEALGKHMAEQWKSMYHDGSPPADIAASMIAGKDGTGLMSSVKRFNSGVFTEGMSTSTDFGTGGADGVFMRVSKSVPTSTGGGIRFIIDTEKVMGRLDWWGFNHDNYGRAGYDQYGSRWSIPDQKSTSHPPGTNEIMATNGIPPSAIKHVICSRSYRDEVLAGLRTRGVTHVNGTPIEEYVKLSK